jgi:hypothetical protein
MNRVLDVVRVQAFNWRGIVAWPLGILAFTLALNIAIFGAIGDAAPAEGRVTGALSSIYIVMFVAHLQTMTQVFPFAIGLSVTRRAFFAGSALVVVAQALFFGLVLLLLEQVERATGGWGVGVRYFGLPFVIQENPFAQWLVYVVPFLAVSAIGVFLGVVFKRWGQTGMYVLTITLGVLLAGFAIVVTWQRWWPSVGSFFTGQSTFALLAGYPLAIALLLGAVGWLAIRRATP